MQVPPAGTNSVQNFPGPERKTPLEIVQDIQVTINNLSKCPPLDHERQIVYVNIINSNLNSLQTINLPPQAEDTVRQFIEVIKDINIILNRGGSINNTDIVHVKEMSDTLKKQLSK